MKKNIKMSKNKIQEEESFEINVNNSDYKKYGDRIDTAAGDDGTIIVNKEKMDENLAEDVKLPLSSVLNVLGIKLFQKTPEEKAQLLQLTREFMGNLSKFGVRIQISEDGGEENSSMDDGEFERESNRIEYGVDMNEDFDGLMKELVTKGAPTINIKENINPRIKKTDLINYINTKK
jgi:hypothetical protein